MAGESAGARALLQTVTRGLDNTNAGEGRHPLERLLHGAWRRTPPPLSLSLPALEEAAPLLLRTGGGALGWWRVRGSRLGDMPVGRQLRKAYQFHTIRAALREHHLRAALVRLRAAGVEPLVVKGWVVARHYPEPGLRPSGDIDLYVSPADCEKAVCSLEDLSRQGCPMDVCGGLPALYDRTLEELRARADALPLGDLEVRTPGREDQLRLLCLHFWHHHGWRPLWLCDIAAALESLPAGFDWDLCLSGDPRLSGWVQTALRLAGEMLGADLQGVPLAGAAPAPSWLRRAVLEQWLLSPQERHFRHEEWRVSFAPPNWRSSGGLLRQLGLRYRHPIQATVELRQPFNTFPRAPLQVAATAAAAWKALTGRNPARAARTGAGVARES